MTASDPKPLFVAFVAGVLLGYWIGWRESKSVREALAGEVMDRAD